MGSVTVSRRVAGRFEPDRLDVNGYSIPPPASTLPLAEPDFQLVWPRVLFVDELRAILNRSDNGAGSVGELLLEEAFTGLAPVEVFKASEWEGRRVLAELARRADELRERNTSRPRYYMERLQESAGGGPDWDGAKRRLSRLVKQLDDRGYFDRAWGIDCVDEWRDRSRPIDAVEDALGIPDVDPLGDATTWTTDVFLSVVEVLHDVVARPRKVESYHTWNDCGRHYSEPAVGPGQAVYRMEINRLFADRRIPFRIAEVGEDRGRVVGYSDDAREELVRDVIETARPSEQNALRHAIALFRSRSADRDSKRSAVSALARILEGHRSLLKETLYSKDEGSLFQIANEFDVRHQREGQKADYDVAFLDWTFWWYLATIELITRLLDRRPEDPM